MNEFIPGSQVQMWVVELVGSHVHDMVICQCLNFQHECQGQNWNPGPGISVIPLRSYDLTCMYRAAYIVAGCVLQRYTVWCGAL